MVLVCLCLLPRQCMELRSLNHQAQTLQSAHLVLQDVAASFLAQANLLKADHVVYLLPADILLQDVNQRWVRSAPIDSQVDRSH